MTRRLTKSATAMPDPLLPQEATPDPEMPPRRSHGGGKLKTPITGKLRAAAAKERLAQLRGRLRLHPLEPAPPAHDAALRSLGLLDFARLGLQSDPSRPDLVVQLVAYYDQGQHRSFVRERPIAVSRSDLARALSLPSKPSPAASPPPDVDSAALVSAAVLEFMRVYVLPPFNNDDDTLTPEVAAATQAVRDGSAHKIDWAGLIWGLVEKEILELPNRDDRVCYYGPYLQRLIWTQKRDLFGLEESEDAGADTRSKILEEPEIKVAPLRSNSLDESGDADGDTRSKKILEDSEIEEQEDLGANNNVSPGSAFFNAKFSEPMQNLLFKASMFCEEKEREIQQALSQKQYMANLLREKDTMIQSLNSARFEKENKYQEKLRCFEHDLNVMGQLVIAYQKVLKQSQASFSEYRKKFPSNKFLYHDVPSSGGLVASVSELKRKRWEEEQQKLAAANETIEDFQREWFSKPDEWAESIAFLCSKTEELAREIDFLKEKRKAKVAALATEESFEDPTNVNEGSSNEVAPCENHQDPTNVNEGSSNEVAPCENHHTLKSADNPTDDEPLKRKRRKKNVTSNACLGETTMGHQDQHMPSLSRESDGDGRSKLIPGTKTKEPPTLSYLDNTCSQSQYVDPPDVNEGSSNEVAPCENHHTLKSPGNPTDDEPPKRKKRKIDDTSNSCPGETTRRTCSSHDVLDITSVEAAATSTPAPRQISPQRGSPLEKSRCKEAAHPKGARRTRSSHVVRDITSAEAETTSMPVVHQTTCRNSSIGRPATQEKPVCKKSKRDRHCKVVHVQDKRIPCTFEFDSCYMKFKTLAHLNSHVKNIHNSKKTPLVCRFEGCPEVFSTRHEKSLHQKSIAHVEVGTEPQMYKCHFQGCTSTFPEIDAVNRHFRKVHGQDERILCTRCNSTFTRKDSLDRHWEGIHNSKETPLACGFEGCREVFFVKHEKSSHEKSSAHVEFDEHGAARIKCGIKGCLTTFAKKTIRNVHYREQHKKTSSSRGVSGRPRKKKT